MVLVLGSQPTCSQFVKSSKRIATRPAILFTQQILTAAPLRRCLRPIQATTSRRQALLGITVLGSAVPSSSSSSASEAVSTSSPAAATVAVTAPATPAATPSARIPPTEVDSFGVNRLRLQAGGWNSWKWRDHKVNWLSAGDSGPIVVLVHGFGASVYHWRYLVPQLAGSCRVFALDTLGFGWSDKALVEYEGYGIWSDQIADFVRDVVHKETGNGGEKVVLVGNSLGGYNSLATAAAHPLLVKGVVLLNAAGRFDEVGGEGDEEAAPAGEAAAAATGEPTLLQKVTTSVGAAIKRAVVSASFMFTKQPARVRQVLKQVYVDERNIDDDLVSSILLPAQDPAAGEVFYRVITAKGTPVNRLLDRLNGAMPLYLLWGQRDPWCVPARALQIQRHYPKAELDFIESGHCPHDDTPALVGAPLLEWVQKLEA